MVLFYHFLLVRKPIVTGEVPLPFVYCVCGATVPINDGIVAILSCVVKKASSINLPPPIWIPTKGGHFAIEESNYFFLSFLLGASVGMNDFNLVKEARHLP